MKTKTLLIGAVLFFALSVCAFAQTAYTVSAETLDKVACCGLAEPTGSLRFTAVSQGEASVTGTITVRYNIPIANNDLVTPVGNPYRAQVKAVDITGVLLPVQPTWTITNDGSNGVVVIAVPAGYTWPHAIVVYNVRVNVSLSCGTLDNAVTAQTWSVGNTITNSEQTALVVKGVAQPLKTPVIAPAAVTIDASNGTVTGTPTITIAENFLTAFGISASPFPEPFRSQQTMIRVMVSGIPSGVSITFPAATAAATPTYPAFATVGGVAVTITSASVNKYVDYVMTSASDPTAKDSFVVMPTVLAIAPFPLAPATITVSAAMAPITLGATATAFPQFTTGCETATATFGSVSGVLNTILLVPYATTESGYNTAISVANTTKDPGTLAMANFPGAIPQAGKITIYFYPKDGSTIATWVSTSYPSQYGLDSTGKLPAGGTFVALLTALLPPSVTEFGGYMFIVTDFTNAHGEYFVSNFSDFTHGALMLVVNDSTNPTAGRTVETGLNQ